MAYRLILSQAAALLCCCCLEISADDLGPSIGPFYDRFRLTLAPGERTEAAGPLFFFERKETTRLWASPPVFSYVLDEDTDFEEFDFLYPLLTYNRFGPEYRFQIIQLFSFAGGQTLNETNVHRFTLFPIYFQQRSEIPEKNYTAFLPIYGTLKNRLLRDEIRFVLLPLYVMSRKRDVVTCNYLYPIFHWRRGNGLKGWQVWPVIGHEHKDVTARTNHWGEVEVVGGHEKFFAAWPLFFDQETGIGTANPARFQALLPLYSMLRSPLRDSTTYFWPFGVTHTMDREKNYTEWAAPWPLIVFARGEGKYTSRVWPFFSQAHNDTLESNWYLWPVYRYNRVTSAPLDRERTRLLLFLYSDIVERNTETGTALRRRDLWPLFTVRRDHEGPKRLQVLSILEPILPNNKSIERNYSQLWSIWRSEKNGRTGASSQSLLWNLYRRDAGSDFRKFSLLFGLFQYESGAEGRRWRLFFIPLGKKNRPEPELSAAH